MTDVNVLNAITQERKRIADAVEAMEQTHIPKDRLLRIIGK